MLKAIVVLAASPLIVALVLPEIVFLRLLATAERWVHRDKIREQQGAIDEALVDLERRIASLNEQPMWQVLRDLDNPREDTFEFGIHPEYGVLVRTGEDTWQEIGVDMPEYLPPRAEDVV